VKQAVQRPYSGAIDLQRMLDLVKARPLDRLTDFPSLADLQEMLGSELSTTRVQLWDGTGGKLAGFALLQDYRTWTFLVMEAGLAAPVAEMEAQMVAWGEQIVRHLSNTRKEPVPMEVNVKVDDDAKIARLEVLGFKGQPGGSVSLSRSLSEPIPTADIPPGFVICPSAGEQEIEEWVRLHRLARGTENMTVAKRRSMLRTPFYDPSLDLVASASDGSLAAYCVCWISAEENALTGRKDGHTDPIATHPAYQRRGLAKALILAGLRLFKERGMEAVHLGTARDNLGMLRTAESVGFRIVSESLWFSKPIA
jgi:mycothiol synthase